VSGKGSSRRKRPKRRYQIPETPSSRRRRDPRGRAAVPLIVAGGVLFLMGNIGARTGIHFLPFDPHHIFEQFGGAVVLVVGLMWLGR